MSRVKKARRVKKEMPKIGKKTCRSNFEFGVYKALTNELPRGAELEYEPERLPYVIESDYIPDFVITKRDGTKIYIEAKGLGKLGGFDDLARRKMSIIRTTYPELDIRIVFQKDGVLKRGMKMRASDWALKNNYPCAFGAIPEGWFDE